MRSPMFLLLDEPLPALDALLRLELQGAIAQIVREGSATAVLVTHDVDEALYLADPIVVLDGSPARAALEFTVPAAKRRSRPSASSIRERFPHGAGYGRRRDCGALLRSRAACGVASTSANGGVAIFAIPVLLCGASPVAASALYAGRRPEHFTRTNEPRTQTGDRMKHECRK